MSKSFLFVLIVMFLASSFVSGATHKNVIFGAWVKYNTSSSIYVTAGSGRCNDNFWEVTSETSVNLSSVLPAGEDFLYVYIDDSASSYPTPTFIGSTTEPAWSDSKAGWYNGNDRCIGSLWCDSYGNIVEFQNNESQEYITFSPDMIKELVTNGNPNGAWQTVESTAYIPVNAKSVYLWANNSDLNGEVFLQVAPYENTHNRILARGYYCQVNTLGWMPLQRGWSRDLKWYGKDDDDNYYLLRVYGYCIER